MSRRLAFAAALAAPLVLSPAARAGTLLTAPSFVAVDDNFSCQLVNGGKKAARDIVIELVRYGPGVAGTIELANQPVDLAPLAYLASGTVNSEEAGIFGCRFQFKGSSKALRGTALVTNASGILDSQAAR
jgi:hypothetical protein